MKTGYYRVAKQSGCHSAFAEVTVEVCEFVNGPTIRTAQTALEGRYDDWCNAAIRGVQYALEYAIPQPSLRSLCITITRIYGTDADTTEIAVSTAACQATWHALGILETHSLTFENVDNKILDSTVHSLKEQT
jgi:hypothetical protein